MDIFDEIGEFSQVSKDIFKYFYEAARILFVRRENKYNGFIL